jgi:hypothetical protein
MPEIGVDSDAEQSGDGDGAQEEQADIELAPVLEYQDLAGQAGGLLPTAMVPAPVYDKALPDKPKADQYNGRSLAYSLYAADAITAIGQRQSEERACASAAFRVQEGLYQQFSGRLDRIIHNQTGLKRQLEELLAAGAGGGGGGGRRAGRTKRHAPPCPSPLKEWLVYEVYPCNKWFRNNDCSAWIAREWPGWSDARRGGCPTPEAYVIKFYSYVKK